MRPLPLFRFAHTWIVRPASQFQNPSVLPIEGETSYCKISPEVSRADCFNKANSYVSRTNMSPSGEVSQGKAKVWKSSRATRPLATSKQPTAMTPSLRRIRWRHCGFLKRIQQREKIKTTSNSSPLRQFFKCICVPILIETG